MTDDIALLPCPFCGGPAQFDSYSGVWDSFQVACEICDARSEAWQASEKIAAEKWNTRTNPTTLAAFEAWKDNIEKGD